MMAEKTEIYGVSPYILKSPDKDQFTNDYILKELRTGTMPPQREIDFRWEIEMAIRKLFNPVPEGSDSITVTIPVAHPPIGSAYAIKRLLERPN